MSATTMLPACDSAGGSTKGSFGAASVTVIAARRHSPIGSAESADSPLGRSIATTGRPDALMSAATVSIIPASGDLRPVPKMASTRRSHCEISEKCRSHACSSAISTTVSPRRPRISRFWRASPLMPAIDATTKMATSTPRWWSVRATTNPSPPLLPGPHNTATLLTVQVFVRRFERGDDLSPGVLHQHHRRDPDLVDGLSICVAHLRGVQNPHLR